MLSDGQKTSIDFSINPLLFVVMSLFYRCYPKPPDTGVRLVHVQAVVTRRTPRRSSAWYRDYPSCCTANTETTPRAVLLIQRLPLVLYC